jgi:hypothetical protein
MTRETSACRASAGWSALGIVGESGGSLGDVRRAGRSLCTDIDESPRGDDLVELAGVVSSTREAPLAEGRGSLSRPAPMPRILSCDTLWRRVAARPRSLRPR